MAQQSNQADAMGMHQNLNQPAMMRFNTMKQFQTNGNNLEVQDNFIRQKSFCRNAINQSTKNKKRSIDDFKNLTGMLFK